MLYTDELYMCELVFVVNTQTLEFPSNTHGADEARTSRHVVCYTDQTVYV